MSLLGSSLAFICGIFLASWLLRANHLGFLSDFFGFSFWLTATLIFIAAGFASTDKMNKWKRHRWVLVLAFLCGGLRSWSSWQHMSHAHQLPRFSEQWTRFEISQASTPGPKCRVLVHSGKKTNPWRFSLDPALCPLASGQRIWVRSQELTTSELSLPGMPTAQERGQNEGIAHTFTISQAWRARDLKLTFNDHYWAWVAQKRQQAWAWSQGHAARAFMMAVTIGLNTALPPQQKQELRTVGLGHLIAVSGMHVGVCALLFRGLLLRLSLRFGVSLSVGVLLSCLPVIAYVGLTGASPSAIRAAIMFLWMQVGVAMGKPNHGLTALALTGAIMLAWQPAWAFSPGFHLSMAAMMVLVHPQAPQGILAQSWHITWVTMPIALFHFGQASAYGILSNLLAIPIFTLWVIPLGLIGHIVAPWLGSSAFIPATLGAEVILDLSKLLARLPSLSMDIGCLCALLVVGLRVGTRHRRFAQVRWRKALPSSVVALAIIAISWQRDLLSLKRILQTSSQQSASIPAWIVLGSQRSLSQIVPAHDLANARMPFACIQNPTLPTNYWPSLLAALDYRGVATIERSPKQTKKGSNTQPAPHIHDLRQQLHHLGLFLSPDMDYRCSYLPVTRARTALQSCLDMSQQSFAIVRPNLMNHSCECFIDGVWQPSTTTEDACS